MLWLFIVAAGVALLIALTGMQYVIGLVCCVLILNGIYHAILLPWRASRRVLSVTRDLLNMPFRGPEEKGRLEAVGFIVSQVAFVFLMAILCINKPSRFLAISALAISIINLIYSLRIYSRSRPVRHDEHQ